MLALVKLIVLLAALGGVTGTAVAVTQPDSPIAGPFKTPAIAVLELSETLMGAISDTAAVAAKTELRNVTTVVHAMRIVKGWDKVPVVTVPTNDMTKFPSPQSPLYPAQKAGQPARPIQASPPAAPGPTGFA